MAIANIYGEFNFPFIFGGDGVACVIPPQNLKEIEEVLIDTSRKVKEFFNLELRVAMIPVKKL
jgi:hypothetical protein